MAILGIVGIFLNKSLKKNSTFSCIGGATCVRWRTDSKHALAPRFALEVVRPVDELHQRGSEDDQVDLRGGDADERGGARAEGMNTLGTFANAL